MKRPEHVDRFALQNLRQLGVELEGERPVDFYFYFPEEYQAYHAAAALTNFRFDTEISYSKYGDRWLCLATKKIHMTSGRLMDLRSWMEDLAERNGGEYDGWETMIELEQDQEKTRMPTTSASKKILPEEK